MVESILFILIFITGIYFGSFFTLAVPRIPKGENIINKRSYCPNCNHRLEVLDLVPLFSYLVLGGKCRYCKQPIRIRYFLFELLTGIVFVAFAGSLSISLYEIDYGKMIELGFGILYFSSLFLIAGIDKENHTIQKSVLVYGILVSLVHMVYAYTLQPENVYTYVIYVLLMIGLLVIDTRMLKKKLKNSYPVQIAILTIYMFLFSGILVTIMTMVATMLAVGFYQLVSKMSKRKTKIQAQKTIPIGFFMCALNIAMLIGTNYIQNYLIK